MNIKKSLYYRAKSFIIKEDFNSLLKRNNLSEVEFSNVSREMIETCETIANYQKQSNILLDIGAHKGLFSKVANAFFNFEKTICFEPNHLHNNTIKNNNRNSNLTIENIALSDQEGEASFYLHQDDSMNSIVDSDKKILKDEFPWDNPELMKETRVKTTTLDKYTEKNNLITNTFFIKIDTQGNELNVLKNGIKTLRKTEICLIEYMFLSPYNSTFSFFQLVEFMEYNGFDCKGALTILKRPSKKISGVDFLFVKKK
jgi:FkbM family methyltransferase